MWPYLPSVIMDNVQSLIKKMDEICARSINPFRTASVMSFVETWLRNLRNDALVAVDGFKLLHGDRKEEYGKAGGLGVCAYVNEKWCHPNNAVIKRHWCSPHLECLTVSLRLYYLPREFSHIIYNTIYGPNRNVAKQARYQELCEIIDNIETSSGLMRLL